MRFAPSGACCACGCCAETKPANWSIVIDGLAADPYNCTCPDPEDRNGTYVAASVSTCLWRYTFALHDNPCCHLTIGDRDTLEVAVEPAGDGVKITVTLTMYWKTWVYTPDGGEWVCAAYQLIWSKTLDHNDCGDVTDESLDFQNEGFTCGTPTCTATAA